MSDSSAIEWCTATWNFLIGCTKKSRGCMHCYAIRQAWRLMHNPNPKIAKKFEGTVARDTKGELNWTGRINFDEEALLLPRTWRLPRRIFVNSLSDLFHPNVKDEWIDAAFAVMALCRQHTFQILTKHPDRAARYFWGSTVDVGASRFNEIPGDDGQRAIAAYRERRIVALESRLEEICQQAYDRFEVMFSGDATSDDFVQLDFPLPNVQILTSIEDQSTANERVPWLLRIPSEVLGLSIEPLLGPIDLGTAHPCGYYCDPDSEGGGHHDHDFITPGINTRVKWVIVGGESGPEARPMNPEWARNLRDQCVAAAVPFFFKQWGGWAEIDGPHCRVIDQARANDFWIGRDGELVPYLKGGSRFSAYHDSIVRRVGKKAAGRLLDGREWNELPEANV